MFCFAQFHSNWAKLVDPILKDQNLRFLAAVDLELLNCSNSEGDANNLNDRITCVHATQLLTDFLDTCALKMFQDSCF